MKWTLGEHIANTYGWTLTSNSRARKVSTLAIPADIGGGRAVVAWDGDEWQMMIDRDGATSTRSVQTSDDAQRAVS